MDLFFDKEFHELIPPLEPEELSELEDSIKQYGNLVPIIIWKEKRLVLDGHNRYDLCTKHGRELKTPIEMSFPDRESAMLWLIDNQLARRNLSKFARTELVMLREEIRLRTEAKKKQKDTYPKEGQKGFQATNVGEISPQHKEDTDTKIAKTAGVSDNTVRKIRKIREKATPEQKAKLVKGEATINQVFVQIHRQEVKEQIKQTDWPTGQYRVIYADPPWKYSNTMPDNFVEQADHYQLKTAAEIAELPVKDLALDNAVLFLWCTSPILEQAFQVINAWGFKYKASFVWDKVKHNMGHYNSVRHEFLLVAIRGSCQPDTPKLYDSVQSIGRTDHSKKPAYFREIIETLYPYGPKLELFASEKVNGWEVFGNDLS